MQKEVVRIIRDIKSLKIQGARNVAKEAVRALIIEAEKSKAATPEALKKDMQLTGNALAHSRPTEPMMRNSIDSLSRFLDAEMKRGNSPEVLKRALSRQGNAMLERMDREAAKLFEYGAGLVPDNALVLTICHSSTATGILRKAKSMGKRFSVVACETRPRYQGRITATELAKAGIDVTLVVDGAANMMMKKADMVLVGADSVTSKGDLINKVGTAMVAHLARIHDVSFFSAAELSKFNPYTMYGAREKIEEREPKEVWDKPARGVKVRNPAFDVTASGYISGYVTELGVIPPQSFFNVATQKLGIKI